MRTRSRIVASGIAIGMAAVLLAASMVTAQTGYKAPRTADGKPNLGGVWQAMNSANWDIEAHSAAPSPIREMGALGLVAPGVGIVEGGPLPYKPEALKKKQENYAKRMELDPEVKCYLPGTPRAMYMPYPFQIVQNPKHVMMVFEFTGGLRTVYMDNHTPEPADSWMGWSNGRWEGETLVIETTGFNDLSWFDRAGNHHSERLKVVERISARSADTLNYEATIDDPNVFTRPWKMSFPLYRRVERDARVLEIRCVEFVEDLIYGHLKKPGLK